MDGAEPGERRRAINTNRERNGTAVLYRRIGSTTYKLRVHLSDTAQETIDDKILHTEKDDRIDEYSAQW